MKKHIRLVLNKDISKLGKFGDLVEVTPGYARNYLIPNNLAVTATPGILKQIERRCERERQRQLALEQQALQQKVTLENADIFKIPKQAGEANAIFGTVTTQDVADVIHSVISLEVDKRDITIPDIRSLGIYEAEIKLHSEVKVKFAIEVIAN